ncbi:MAG: thiol reductant ABC exporter subunit CydC, partial [Nocardioides sp.]|nr:thiol reductant ABC exporter subunit CydC [Nocardioides sp.]
ATLLGSLAAASGVALTATAGWLIARSAEQPPILMLTVAIVGVRAFGLARPAFGYAERLLSHDLALRTLAERRAVIYDRLVPLVPARIGRRGDVLAGIVDDVDAHLDDRLRVRLPVATWLGVSALSGACAWIVLPRAAPVVLAVALGGGLASFLAGWAGGRRHEARFVAARGEVSRRTTDLVSSARQLVLWQSDDSALDDIDEAGLRLARASDGSIGSTAAGRAMALLAAGLGVVATAVLGAPALADDTVSGPMLALLLLLPLALADVILPLADAGSLRVRTAAAETRVRDLTATTPAVLDPATAAELPTGPHALRLTNATSSWTGDRRDLDAISLELAPGRHVGVIGPSGSGKSTLAAVLLKLLPLTEGDYRINETDVADLAADDVRRVVGLLDDDPYLFGSTLVENVRLANPDAGDVEVELALRAAHLGAWLDALPRGLHTRIGDGGDAVSGGERARIGLARAVLAGRHVLVLDEPTAHLDTATAHALTRDLLTASADRTLVWITHDTVGMDRMDEVVELGNALRPAALGTAGRIVSDEG